MLDSHTKTTVCYPLTIGGVVILTPKKKIPIIDCLLIYRNKTLSIDKANEKSVSDRDVSVLKG